MYIQGVQDKFYILIFCYLYIFVGGIDAHYLSFESLDTLSLTYVMTERIDEWNQPESWKRITCIIMIHTGHQDKEIMAAAQCSLNTVKTIRHDWRFVMEITRLWLEESNITDVLIVFIQ